MRYNNLGRPLNINSRSNKNPKKISNVSGHAYATPLANVNKSKFYAIVNVGGGMRSTEGFPGFCFVFMQRSILFSLESNNMYAWGN